MSRKELLRRLTDATATLHAAQLEQWKALLDLDEDNATLAEMANAMGINRQTVRARISKAREATGRTTRPETE